MGGCLSKISNQTQELIPERVLFGSSQSMQEIRAMVENVAGTPVPVLLQGERGTGKQTIAKEIHRRSPLGAAAFVPLFERSEIPHPSERDSKSLERGEHPSPLRLRLLDMSRSGSVGTLFVDDVNELDRASQATLLECFQNDRAHPVDAAAHRLIFPRIICATRRDLQSEVARRAFRMDLCYRINVVTIQLPSLRDRKEDIPALSEYFLEIFCREQGRDCRPIPSNLIAVFFRYDWPGNVGELRNCVQRYLETDGNAEVVADLLVKKRIRLKTRQHKRALNLVSLTADTPQVAEPKEHEEKELILKVLREQRWNRRETARILQVSYHTLLNKLNRNDIDEKKTSGSSHAVVKARENPLR